MIARNKILLIGNILLHQGGLSCFTKSLRRYAENTPRPVNTEEIKTVLSAYEGLSRAGKKAFWSRVLTKIVPIPDTGEFLLLYTNGNITDDILPFVHNRLS